MDSLVKDYFEEGVLFPTFHVLRNIKIWEYISDESEYLNNQEANIRAQYIYIQISAQSNYILYLGKLFDRAQNYPTRCIESFLKLLLNGDKYSIEKVIEDISTENLLRKFNCSDDCKIKLFSDNVNDFPKALAQHYLERYKSEEISTDINLIKKIRDKIIAHNEVINDFTTFEFDINAIMRLVEFSTEIISIFGMAYQFTNWDNGFLKIQAERESAFVKVGINNLKGKSQLAG